MKIYHTKFDLIYQGSRDKIDTGSFSNKCNLQVPIYLSFNQMSNSRRICSDYTILSFYIESFNRNCVSYYDSLFFK
jgi:hypothetical protein